MPERSSKRGNPHAVALGRAGGIRGGPARARKLSPQRRSEIAAAAARARWGQSRAVENIRGSARERILNAARSEFAARGFDAARIDRIAARANVNRRTIYDHFGSKDGLFREMLRRSVVSMSHLAATSPAGTFGEQLGMWFDAIGAHPQWTRLSMWEAISSPIVRVAAAERRSFWAQAVKQVERGQSAGALPQCDAAFLELALIALVMFPHLLPTLASLVTGLAPDSEEFGERQRAFLRDFGTWITSRGTFGPRER